MPGRLGYQNEKRSVRVRLTGSDKVVEIPTDDLDDTTRSALWKKAISDGTEVSRANDEPVKVEPVDEPEVDTHGLRQKHDARAKNERGMMLRIADKDVMIPRGDMGDEAWEQVKKTAQDQGAFYGVQVDAEPETDQTTPRTAEDVAFDRYRGRRAQNEAVAAGSPPGFPARSNPVEARHARPDMPAQFKVEVLPEEQTGDVPGAAKFFSRAVSGAATQAVQEPEARAEQVATEHAAGNTQLPGIETSQHYDARILREGLMRQYNMSEQEASQLANTLSARRAQMMRGAGDPSIPMPRDSIAPEQVQTPPPFDPARAQAADTLDKESMRLMSSANLARPKNSAGLEQRIEEDANARILAEKKGGDILAEGQRQKARLLGDRTKLQGEQAAEMALMQERKAARQEEARRGIERAQARVREVAKVDPNRYWNNMSTGNKILGGLAVLFSGAGQGSFAALGVRHENQALQIMRDAIRMDMEAQQFDIGNEMQMRREDVAGQRALYDMLRQEGFDEVEAKKGEHAIKLDMVANEIERYGAMMGSEEAVQKAQAAAAAIRMDTTKLLKDLAVHRDNVDLDVGKVRSSIALSKAKAAGDKATQLRDPTLMELSQGLTAKERMSQLEKDFKGVHGIMNKIARLLPGTDAKAFDIQRNIAMRQIGRFIDRSVLQKHDIDPDNPTSWDALFPFAGEVDGDVKLKFLRELLQESYQNQINTLRQGGRAVPGDGTASAAGQQNPDW